ncbi:MAG: nitric-oxide reductase large subunit [candidate division Zixibacteria bacterium]|nr:nitric-oxide reductase large subunit [candidate division Zixibacteria bacterium]MDD5426974.1 nitric-oxide reductase large subunit [candidate division Zixibacteria bacterium]
MFNPRIRALLLFLLVICFGILLFGGYLIKRDKPPIPDRVISSNGEVVFTGRDIIDGQNYYFSRGGQHIGSIWGHGSYLAPDWSADYIHRMALYMVARHYGLPIEQAKTFDQKAYEKIDAVRKAELGVLIQQEIRQNRYDKDNKALVYTDYQIEAFQHLQEYYTGLFKNGNERMGLQPGIVKNEEEGRLITGFFSWLAWAASTNRPGQDYTYTSNWPSDELVGNKPMPGSLIWSIVSVVLLILAVAVVMFLYLRYMRDDDYSPEALLAFKEPTPTGSQKATLVYFSTAMVLFVVQALAGSVTGHFTLEGTRLFGISLANILPYAAIRSWHIQLGIFWIATCFLAAGLFIGPYVGREPNRQRFWVITLFGAVVVVVIGALSGTLMSVLGQFGGEGFYLGHQGYEYIELGRVWQLLLVAGMIIWLILVFRSIIPAIRKEDDSGGLTHMLLYSSIAIPLFYMAGLMYTKGSHLSDAEYWRWWVVHLWVEAFFEVFATVILAFILSRIGAVNKKFALTTVYASITLYLGSGVIGTFHHLYWSGTPTPIIALGAVFSALEIVPLTLLGFEAAHNLKIVERGGRNYAYKWPLYFFIAVAFWNMLGAGVFGFLINPPIVLYYAQGLNTTPLHGHTALFGVYGFLAIALMLFSVRNIVPPKAWSDKLLKWGFWLLNGGLMAMTVFNLAPSGFYQFYKAVKHGLWYARSPEITSGAVMQTLSWMRVVPDLVFIAGAVVMVVFIARASLMRDKTQAGKQSL